MIGASPLGHSADIVVEASFARQLSVTCSNKEHNLSNARRPVSIEFDYVAPDDMIGNAPYEIAKTGCRSYVRPRSSFNAVRTVTIAHRHHKSINHTLISILD